jgi:hypothetical protein
MVARRLLTFLVLLLVITALSAGLVAPPPQKAPPAASPTPQAAPTEVITERIDADQPRPRTVTVRSGDLLSLTVTAGTADAVELQGLSTLRALDPEAPVTFDVLADVPGDYPVVLIGAARTVGTVRVLSRRE